MTTSSAQPAEFKRPVDLGAIGDDPAQYQIMADDAERAALARRFGLVEIQRLSAAVTLVWVRGRRVLRLTAEIEGEVVQNCVVTLDPVHERIAERVEIHFERPARDAAAKGGIVDEFELGEAEPLTGDALDIGEIVAGEFVLCVNPYPRKPDASIGTVGTESHAPSPFEKLASIKRNN